MASAGMDSKVFVYDVANLKKVVEFEKVHRGGSYSVVFDKDHNIFTGGGDAVLKLIDTNKYI